MNNESIWEEEEDAWENEPELMRFKWLADGCATWDEVIERLQERIEWIKELKAQGYRIVQSEDDYLFYEQPSKEEIKDE